MRFTGASGALLGVDDVFVISLKLNEGRENESFLGSSFFVSFDKKLRSLRSKEDDSFVVSAFVDWFVSDVNELKSKLGRENESFLGSSFFVSLDKKFKSSRLKVDWGCCDDWLSCIGAAGELKRSAKLSDELLLEGEIVLYCWWSSS